MGYNKDSIWDRNSENKSVWNYSEQAQGLGREMNQKIVDGDYAGASELRDRLNQLNKATGHTPGNRLDGMAVGAAEDYFKCLPNLRGAIIEGTGRRRDPYDYLKDKDPKGSTWWDAANEFYGIADKMDQSAQQKINRAKEGLDPFAAAGVDLGVGGLQLLLDGAGAYALPAAFPVLKAAQVLSNGMQEARTSGADYGKQLDYGWGKTILKYGTERISNPTKLLGKIWGGDFGKKVLTPVLKDFLETPKGKAVATHGGEVFGHLLNNALTPVLKRMTYDKTAPWKLRGVLYQSLIDTATNYLSAIDGKSEQKQQ